ncbi:MAG TPA: hypothetical protein VIM62_04775 [Acidobacteriaceae bacterium]
MRKNKQYSKLPEAIAAGMFLVTCIPALYAQSTSVNTTDFCAVVKEPQRFDGQTITVRARVQSDGTHGSLIYDESCSDRGVTLFVFPNAKGSDQLDAALSWCHRTTRGKLILGNFTGVFHFKPIVLGDQIFADINVSRIDDIVLKSTKTTSATFPTPCPEAPSIESLVEQSKKKNRQN